MAVDFRELLNVPVDEIERPKSVPRCHLLGRIPNPGYEYGTTRGNGTPFVRIKLIDVAPGPDCTPDMIEGINLAEREFRVDMWATPKALNRLDRMLDAILGPNTNKRTCYERLPDINDMPVMFGVSPRTNEDGTDSGYNDVTTVAARPEE